ncbi:hypothetical protein DFH06DRAFT_1123263 [Mycena polygramma]|nr:hypothetical protein DFH06DRAFT_1123263 [Mycena polygramma]
MSKGKRLSGREQRRLNSRPRNRTFRWSSTAGDGYIPEDHGATTSSGTQEEVPARTTSRATSTITLDETHRIDCKRPIANIAPCANYVARYSCGQSLQCTTLFSAATMLVVTGFSDFVSPVVVVAPNFKELPIELHCPSAVIHEVPKIGRVTQAETQLERGAVGAVAEDKAESGTWEWDLVGISLEFPPSHSDSARIMIRHVNKNGVIWQRDQMLCPSLVPSSRSSRLPFHATLQEFKTLQESQGHLAFPVPQESALDLQTQRWLLSPPSSSLPSLDSPPPLATLVVMFSLRASDIGGTLNCDDANLVALEYAKYIMRIVWRTKGTSYGTIRTIWTLAGEGRPRNVRGDGRQQADRQKPMPRLANPAGSGMSAGRRGDEGKMGGREEGRRRGTINVCEYCSDKSLDGKGISSTTTNASTGITSPGKKSGQKPEAEKSDLKSREKTTKKSQKGHRALAFKMDIFGTLGRLDLQMPNACVLLSALDGLPPARARNCGGGGGSHGEIWGWTRTSPFAASSPLFETSGERGR